MSKENRILEKVADLLADFSIVDRHRALVTLMALHVADAPPDKIEPILRAMPDQALDMLREAKARGKDAPSHFRH